MKTSISSFLLSLIAGLLPLAGIAQVNSGSNGSDGAFNPTQSVTIDMADHPDGIYQYTSVNIASGVIVDFKPNANTPVVWLVQGDCLINGTMDVSSRSADGTIGGAAGPGGWAGGSGGSNPSSGLGPGGGAAAPNTDISTRFAEGGSFGSRGANGNGLQTGTVYGNSFLLPLMGGSGGGGAVFGAGGGGGGAILIAASNSVQLNGGIFAEGGFATAGNGGGNNLTTYAGKGSGGGIRLVARNCTGNGVMNAGVAAGGLTAVGPGGLGRVRIDAFSINFGGQGSGVFTQGFQPIILATAGQGVQLAIKSIGGVAAPTTAGGVLLNPDVIIPAQQANPIPVVVHCTNIPLNTEISVVVHPANGPAVQAVGINNAGTAASSTATVSLNMPRGGGIIDAKAVTGIAGLASTDAGPKNRSLAETGWTADGERFKAMEITATLGDPQRIAYITESGKRYPAN